MSTKYKSLPLSDLRYLLDDIFEAVYAGASIYDVIPDVVDDDIETWKGLISDAGLYYKLESYKDVVNIYYSTKDNITIDHPSDGWTQLNG